MLRLTEIIFAFIIAVNLPPLLAITNPIDQAIAEPEQCRISQNYFKKLALSIPTCEELASKHYAAFSRASFLIQNNLISFDGYSHHSFLDKLTLLNEQVKNAASSTQAISLKFSGNTYTFKPVPLGQGERGIVYPMLDPSQVIKIPKNNLKSLRIHQEEKLCSDFWYRQSQDPNINFSVPIKYVDHPLGFFSVMERIKGPTLTQVLIRLNLIAIDRQKKLAVLKPKHLLSDQQLKSLKTIEQAVMDLIKVMRKKRQYSLSISPNNILVTLSKSKEVQVDKVYLIDFGLDSGYHTKYEEVKDFDQYLVIARNKIEGYLKRYPEQF